MSAQPINDGGPAYPCDAIVKRDDRGRLEGHEISGPGMSLRDHFAAKAMQGLLSGSDWEFEPAGPLPILVVIDIALASYQIADAMIKARAA